MAFDSKISTSNIRVRLGALNMTRRELVEKAGVSFDTVQHCVIGEQAPGADKLFAMLDALECTSNNLLGWR